MYERISRWKFDIDGTETEFTIIRDSRVCRALTDAKAISFFNRIYVRDEVLMQRVFRAEMEKIRRRRRDGFWKSCWNRLLNRGG